MRICIEPDGVVADPRAHIAGPSAVEMISGMERNDIKALAATIGNLLAAVEAHTLDASQVDRERLVGALVALRIVLGDDPQTCSTPSAPRYLTILCNRNGRIGPTAGRVSRRGRTSLRRRRGR